MTQEPQRPWVAAIEGFYGPPLAHETRLDLIRWLPSGGLTAYSYGPKDDPYHRDRWRDPYPQGHLDDFAETLDVATAAGIELAVTLSPGLGWREADDEGVLVAKLRQLYDVGIRHLGIQWDDLPPGGRDLGAAHGRAVAGAVRGLPDDVRWLTVGVDYATAHATSYLQGLAAALPGEVRVAWTGPSVTSPDVPAADAQRLADELDRPILLWDNFPVNDLGMAPVLHLGPAPHRDPATREVCTGVGFNFMSLPLASRIGLEVSARHWRDPDEDREAAWREVVASMPGLTPLARACRSWLTDPGPDEELASWVDPALDGDDRLDDFLAAGCRDGLDPDRQRELEPWLAAWDQEADVMRSAIRLARGGAATAPAALELGAAWQRLRQLDRQVFGIRFAVYGLTWRDGDVQHPHPDTVVRGDNLTGLLLTRTFQRLGPGRRTTTGRRGTPA